MSKEEKLLKRLLSIPTDLRWEELTKVVAIFGYEEFTGGKTGGSRRRFVDSNKNIITLHKPHPANIVKSYAIREVIAHLKTAGHLKDE
ncbi:type II toxin-antitoxin system HicA family toxin [Mucilaginibacter mali]|uniref:Type II toxin-antitoxin system HicA family toxin n=1 Tax=Mucilaginibacter mali TaxID=2740462 RepID=A0A7D4UBP6_9SPHI|nr:type II toxin-antitoxin system HicA family toxin [Mucilaginibacter mali]QKJ28319.1 type II toxin-antitoxin system HicA family toxin [Mucilaginibacter mali]